MKAIAVLLESQHEMARIKHPLEGQPIPKRLPKRPTVRRHRDPAYLEWLHHLPCIVSTQSHSVIAHHITIGRNRMGVKEDDSLCVPLASQLHDQHPGALHVVGERSFWNRWGINPFDVARDLYAAFQAGAMPASCTVFLHGYRHLGTARLQSGLKVFDD